MENELNKCPHGNPMIHQIGGIMWADCRLCDQFFSQEVHMVKADDQFTADQLARFKVRAGDKFAFNRIIQPETLDDTVGTTRGRYARSSNENEGMRVPGLRAGKWTRDRLTNG